MDHFRRIFKLSSTDGQVTPLKHSKSMPFRSNAPKECGQHQRPVFRGKGPLKTSDLVYVEQIPGMLDISRSKYQDPSRPGLHASYIDLLDQFPTPPCLPPVPPRSLSLNYNRDTTIHVIDGSTQSLPSGRQRTILRSSSVTSFCRPTRNAYPSLNQSASRKRCEPVIFPTVSNLIPEQEMAAKPLALGSVMPRCADVVHAKRRPTHPEAPAVFPDHRRPPVSRRYPSCHNSRQPAGSIDLSGTAVGDGQGPSRCHEHIATCMDAAERELVRKWIAESPLAPPISDNLPYNLRPVRFDLKDPQCAMVGLDWHRQLAIGTGRPLDARYDGEYHRLLDAGLPKGIVPDVGHNWKEDSLCYAVCQCTTSRRS